MKQCNNVTMKYGFGLLEVLISAGIVVMVIGATVALGRVAIKSGIVSSERTQAFNLLRKNLEVIRAMRDATWVDQKVNKWNEFFNTYAGAYTLAGKTCYLENNAGNWELKGGTGSTNLNGQTFTESITFNYLDETATAGMRDLAKLGSDFNTSDNPVIIRATVTVKWDSYGDEKKVETSTLLTDWKPQL